MARKTARAPPGPPAVAPGREPAVRPGPAPARDRHIWLVAVPLVLLVVAAFFPALDGGVVNWDDQLNFLGNPHYYRLGWPGHRSGGLAPPYTSSSTSRSPGCSSRCNTPSAGWIPAATTWLACSCTPPMPWPSMPSAWHCWPADFLQHPWARAVGTGLATALFAVHPLRVEAMAWASCQPYLPCSPC